MGIDISQGWPSTVVGFSTSRGSATIPVHYDIVKLNCTRCGHHHHSTTTCSRTASGVRVQRPQAGRPGPGNGRDGILGAGPPASTTSGFPDSNRGLRQDNYAQYRPRRYKRRPHFSNQTPPPSHPLGLDADGFITVGRRRQRPTQFDAQSRQTSPIVAPQQPILETERATQSPQIIQEPSAE